MNGKGRIFVGKIDILNRIKEKGKLFSFNHENLNDHENLCVDMESYLTYYNMNYDNDNITYHYGYVKVKDEKVMVQTFIPKGKCKGTVYLVHGYFDHTAYMSHIIAMLVEKNFAVVGFDLIGHGLSTGKRAHITSFNDYVFALEEVMNTTMNQLVAPFAIIGHSTGAAVIIDYLVKKDQRHPFKKVILLAPLVRSANWYKSVAASTIVKPFISKIPRKTHETKNNPFQKLRQQDVLQPTHIPIAWVYAMRKWYSNIQKMRHNYQPIFVIQGEKDEVVDWHYNCKFISKKFPKSYFYFFGDGTHHIAHENEKIKERVLEIIAEQLSKTKA
jgi:alpha-beta hydrolase superfamily lysophospholipase